MHDVAIIGAGVIGCGIARELSRHKLDTVVLESGFDVAVGTSKANSGIVHGGYDAKPGSLKARYNLAGNPMFDELSEDLDFPFKRIGSLVLIFSEDERASLEKLLVRGAANGVKGLRIIEREELLSREPNIGPNACAALDVPSGGIVCPYEMTIALAENAATNGVRFLFGHRVYQVEKLDRGFRILTLQGQFEAKMLVNAAGVFADVINNMLSEEKFNIVPRRGEYFLMDRTESGFVRHTLFQLPGPMGKGVLLSPTVDGNILVGPTSEDVEDRHNTETTAEGLQKILELARRDVVAMPRGRIISSFAGLRAHETSRDDFIVGPAADVPRLINVAGIESPGLSSAPAIAASVAGMITDELGPHANPHFLPVRRAVRRFRHMSNDERREAISRDPNYGHMICRCESVTKAEVIGALRSPLGVSSLDAIKRRTRAGMGRCQAGFCSMHLPEIIAEETGRSILTITKTGGDSRLFFNRNKAGWGEE